MFTFTWSEFVTDAFIQRLDELAGESTLAHRDQIRQALALILRNTGGLRVLETELSLVQMTELAERLLADAIGHYLSAANAQPLKPGHYLIDSKVAGLDARIESMAVVDVNRADQKSLEALPVVGTAIALSIVRDRSENGHFASLTELVERIQGLGAGAEQALQYVTSFEVPVGAPSQTELDGTRLDRLLRRALAGFAGVRSGDRLLGLLESVLSITSRTPHPDTIELRTRRLSESNLQVEAQADFVGVLESSVYYERLPLFLRDAQTSIKVAMFHAAFPGPQHPTRLILDELISAKARGVDVKVVLDQDRDTDPYMSTVINTNAKRYLEDHGVECRFDSVDNLLHSKYVIIDEKLCVLGSHNWSAGSYSEFDDLSFVVSSNPIAAALIARFNQLWN